MENKEEFERNILGYFNTSVLASYKNEPDKYLVETDYLSGEVTLTDNYYKLLKKKNNDKRPGEYIRVRFGYRALKNGEMAVVAFLPDLFKDSSSHLDKWRGFFIRDPKFPNRKDKRFEMWKETSLEGKWNGTFPITRKIYDTISFLNGLSAEILNKTFFKYGDLKKIVFPIAQNTHSYQDAHAKLYGFLIDGISMETLSLLSVKLGIPKDTKGDRTLIELKNILPELNKSKYFTKATKFLREQRSISTHGVPKQALKFNAFERFAKDLNLIYKGYKELLILLEKKLGMKGQVGKRRQESKEMLPVIVKAPGHHYSINKAKYMVGKKIQKVDFGQRKFYKNVHESEALIITFTDGSMLGIDSGSNAVNVSGEKGKIKPTDFHVDFSLSWVPAYKYKKRDYDKYRNPLD